MYIISGNFFWDCFFKTQFKRIIIQILYYSIFLQNNLRSKMKTTNFSWGAFLIKFKPQHDNFLDTIEYQRCIINITHSVACFSRESLIISLSKDLLTISLFRLSVGDESCVNLSETPPPVFIS